MDVQKRLNYLIENMDILNDDEEKQIAHLVLKVKERASAKAETNDDLADLKWLNSELMSKKINALALIALLCKFQQEKGLKADLMSIDALCGLLRADMDLYNHTMSVTKELQHVMQGTIAKAQG